MKRTAQYETLLLNVGKWREVEEVARTYGGEQDRAVVFLSRAGNGHFLDDQRDFLPLWKGNTSVRPVHFHDQVLFDAVATMRRPIEAVKARTHVTSQVFARFEGQPRHYGFWLLRSDG
ncbi:MAG: hypothetical protein M0Z54_15055 [Thermaerobacter sp.]|nr:hypothetical protein [Thermaerobacter sp.]